MPITNTIRCHIEPIPRSHFFDDMYNWHVVLPHIYVKKYGNTFYTLYVPNSNFKLNQTRKFCRTYELQYTHYFFRAKTTKWFSNLRKSLLFYFPNAPEQIAYLMNYSHFVRKHYSSPLLPFLPPPFTLQSSIMGISNFSENSLSLNHLVLIFRYYVYNTRADGNLSIELL